jgi:hypothetical protein
MNGLARNAEQIAYRVVGLVFDLQFNQLLLAYSRHKKRSLRKLYRTNPVWTI